MADAPKTDDQKTEQTSGNVSPESTATADTTLAAAAGISEGDVHALRDEAGLNQLAGHEADLHAWSLTTAGKKFKADEKDREKQAKEEEKAYKAQFDSKGLTKAEANYRDAVNKG